MSARITCCKDCQERHPGCHDKCQAYQKERLKNELRKRKILEEKKKQVDVDNYRYHKRLNEVKKKKIH